MSNVFKKFQGFVDKPKRNTFDLSFQNNLTCQIGGLYPVFCKEVIPGDSFRIKSAFGMRFMPLTFPLQTRMNANLHFFYVRNRNLWEDWPDFIGQTKDGLEMPYLYPSSSNAAAQYGTKSLGDYLGLPSTLVGQYGSNASKSVNSIFQVGRVESLSSSFLSDAWDTSVYPYYYMPCVASGPSAYSSLEVYDFEPAISAYMQGGITYDAMMSTLNYAVFGQSSNVLEVSNLTGFANVVTSSENLPTDVNEYNVCLFGNVNKSFSEVSLDDFRLYFNAFFPSTLAVTIRYVFLVYVFDSSTLYCNAVLPFVFKIDNDLTNTEDGVVFSLDTDYFSVSFDKLDELINSLGSVSFLFGVPVSSSIYFNSDMSEDWNFDSEDYLSIINIDSNSYIRQTDSVSFLTYQQGNQDDSYTSSYFGFVDNYYYSLGNSTPPNGFEASIKYPILNYLYKVVGVGTNTASSQDIASSNEYIPYAFNGSSNEYAIKVNALPFRAYESIYNAFYRNEVNDPFMIDGVAEYNKYLSNTSGGADDTLYELHYALWEKDFLTSAVQSPQQGIAPLVGVTSSGTFTFQDEDGNVYTAKASIGEDGETLTGITSYDQDTPSGSLRMLVDSISHGISINDFRNVNAFQRWLETNIRKGYKYKDQLLSHFGVKASYDVLDMPEFLGGISRPVNVNQVTSTSESDNAPLGSYAANASVMGSSDYSINKYCDEHGFIIGILSVTPVPNYSQLLPKLFLKDSPFDFYFPEFGHIGLQPISYNEVCPVQYYHSEDAADGASVVFGYQRAWYEYLQSVDEIHGDFRLSLADFILSRYYDDPPVLGHDFISISPDEINDVFAVTGTDYDKILGLVYFDCKVQRPIPKFGIPKIE